jgi:integrase
MRGIITKHVKPLIEGAPLSTFGADVVADFYKKLRAAGAGASIMNSASRILHAAFESRRKHTAAPNPFDNIERPRYHPKQVRHFTADEAIRFLNAAQGSKIEPLFALCLTSGLRIGEALALKWDDVDLEGGVVIVDRALTDVNGVIEIGRTKTTRSRRHVDLALDGIEALKRRRLLWEQEGHGSAFVCTGPSGKPLRPSFVRIKYLKPILAEAKLTCTIHSLRHSYSTLLAEGGTSLKTISTMMGHSKSSITLETYQHTDRSAQGAGRDRLDRVLSDAREKLKNVR